MWTAFIEKKKHPVTQRSRYIYLKAFLSFWNGKNNPEATERRWLDSIPLCWEAPKTETHEIVSYKFDEVVDVLKEANRNGVLGFYVMRLFSMMRSHEYERFIDLGGGFSHSSGIAPVLSFSSDTSKAISLDLEKLDFKSSLPFAR